MSVILRDYPVSDDMRHTVLAALAEVERTHGVRILFACESGSRGWGFASPDSDYDVRFIYVHDPDWYVQIDTPRDVIELPINSELDVSGWELKKTLQQLKKANPVIVEWLDSPIIYQADPKFLTAMNALLPVYFSPRKAAYHYRSMALKNYHQFIEGKTEVKFKKYFYVLRPLMALKYIAKYNQTPPMKFAELVEQVDISPELLAKINELLVKKTSVVESNMIAQDTVVLSFIESELAKAKTDLDFDHPEQAVDLLNVCLRQFVSQST